MAKEDNIDNDIDRDSVETIITESDDSENEFTKYFRISNNFKYEYDILIRLKTALEATNAISVNDIRTLINYRNDIDNLLVVLMDIQHTLNLLNEFDKIFKLSEVNAGRFVIAIRTGNRRRRRRVKKRYRKKFHV